MLQYENFNENKLISLRDEGFIVLPYYYKHNIKGSLNDCLANRQVISKLKKAENLLPDKMRFLIFDAWRSTYVQNEIINNFCNNLISENPDLTEDEALHIAGFFEPTADSKEFLDYNNGNCVSLTIVLPEGKYLNMGSNFADTTKYSATNYFDAREEFFEITTNRKLLVNTMQQVGFINDISKWWLFKLPN